VVAAHVAEHEHDKEDQKANAADRGIDEHAALTLHPRRGGVNCVIGSPQPWR
jgi:hypothetical protein